MKESNKKLNIQDEVDRADNNYHKLTVRLSGLNPYLLAGYQLLSRKTFAGVEKNKKNRKKHATFLTGRR